MSLGRSLGQAQLSSFTFVGIGWVIRLIAEKHIEENPR